MTGPIPKRSDELIRRNAPEIPITKVPAVGTVVVPPLGIRNPHPIVRDLYEAMKDSGQARFYEPSDWEYAKLTFHFVNKLLRSKTPSAMMLATVHSMMTSLLLTEGDRRRVRMEVERAPEGSGGKVLQVADMFRQEFEKNRNKT